MKALLTLLTLGLLLLSLPVQGRVYSRCALVKTLRKHGLDNFNGISLANWICLAKWESDYDTGATKYNHEDQSTNYGIFQINSRFWCKDSKTPGSRNLCRIPCKEIAAKDSVTYMYSTLLKSNIKASIACAKRIVKDPRGITTWAGWRENCEREDLSQYIKGCPW